MYTLWFGICVCWANVNANDDHLGINPLRFVATDDALSAIVSLL